MTRSHSCPSPQNTATPTQSIRPWLFEVKPYPDESFSHFLGRFRRANCLSGSHLSSMLGERSPIVWYWERPSCQRCPKRVQRQQLSQKGGVAIARLQQMWSSTLTASNIRYCTYPAVRDASIPFNYRVNRQPVRAIANTSVTKQDVESTKSFIVRLLAHVWCNG